MDYIKLSSLTSASSVFHARELASAMPQFITGCAKFAKLTFTHKGKPLFTDYVKFAELTSASSVHKGKPLFTDYVKFAELTKIIK